MATPLFIVREKVEQRLKSQLSIKVYDAAPFQEFELPYVAQLRETDDKPARASAHLFLHEVRCVLEVVTDPFDEAADDVRTLLKSVVTALESHTWDFTDESFTVDEHHVEQIDREEAEGPSGEELYRAELVYMFRIDEQV